MALRRWQLDATKPLALTLAADARRSEVSYTDDQSWEVSLGVGDSPALGLQTRYGGRVGLASLVPMWWYEGRVVYESHAYARPPALIAFASGYLQFEARIAPDLELIVDYWAMESRAVGGRYTLRNLADRPVEVRLDLFGHIGIENRQLSMAILTLVDGTFALSMGRLAGLEPVVVLENGQAQLAGGQKISPKIGAPLHLEAGQSVSIRWVHAGLSKMDASLERAQFWLAQDWEAAFAQIAALEEATPQFFTGDEQVDAAIAFSYLHLWQSLIDPTGSLPQMSFVGNRQPSFGYSPQGDGRDYGRGWNGQLPQVAYLTALGIAPAAPRIAQGIVENYLAAQSADGRVDMRPGLGGQRSELLCPPILARLTWEVYQYTQDAAFIGAMLPKLLKFVQHWRGLEHPLSWQDEHQTGYVFWPTFAVGQSWSQNVRIQAVNSPDLAGYLLSEAVSLQRIAEAAQDAEALEAASALVTHYREALAGLWLENAGRYAYQDRETGGSSGRVVVLKDARADEEQILALPLSPASRLVIRITGGTGKPPRAAMTLTGLGADGVTKINEAVDLKAFVWSYGQGTYTTRQVFSRVDRLDFEGLSRVYKLNVESLDFTRLDINALLPLMALFVDEPPVEPLLGWLLDAGHFWRAGGIALVSAHDPNFDPASAHGGGGVWPYWTTLLGEALLAHDRPAEAAEAFKRLLRSQVETLIHKKAFHEFYHADEPLGLGEKGFLSGIVPVHLLMQLVGVQIVSPQVVQVEAVFAWGAPITIRQHGVTVKRSVEATEMTFASGQVVTLPAGSPAQRVVDEAAADQPLDTVEKIRPPMPPSAAPQRVTVQVEAEEV